ncbi:anaphase-promoting complex subunit 3 [Plasmodium brasilianum]|uniref:Anaphase-promoting complex subunit, putative n=2 Tax=Plasmodium (Plasmodium) TaxID=418103 RepID=A0A1A8W135_PLAMA|nr:anaphase promoting complex subunit, putative [Plasmodium malariae]KAI4839815.1 anaphase-promoting complex subunit 3 [Plasmodium brasilianum]SBS86594.1 anaphase-promoting complex subunit, putative [Plasmodium malariae]SBT86759.1 anaphase promoting complex subunit, putative [Plasmodium malariae]
MNKDEELFCHLNFLMCAVHLSRKYNLKFQSRLYQDLLDTYYYRKNLRVKESIFPNETYLNYNDLNGLYNYTRRKCQAIRCENIMKYAYIYCCYKLKKEKRRTIALMLLDEDFIKYNCNNNKYEDYKKKNIKIYENNFYNVKSLPGYSAAYYLMGKLYEKEAKREWFNELKKNKLINIASYCYYLCYKSCPFFMCSCKKLLKLHGNFYCNSMYTEEVKKISKLYNFGTYIYQKHKFESSCKDDEEDDGENKVIEKKRNADFDNNILELIEFKEEIINNIDIKNTEFILSLIKEDEIKNFFLKWMNCYKDDVQVSIHEESNNFISKEGIHNLSIIGNFYYYFYVNNFKTCLLLIDKWENKPIFSIFLFYIKGLCYFFLRNYEKCAFFLEKIHNIDCYYTKHLPYLSTCYWYQKKENKIEYILTTYPKREINEHFLCLIGNYFSLKNNKNLAAQFFRRAIQLNAFHEYAYILYSCEMKYLGKRRKAAVALSKCLQINPCNFKAHLLLSVLLFQERKFELANVHLSLCLKLNNTDAIISLYCATIYNHNEKYETALLCLEHAQKNDYEGIYLFIMQGIIFLKIRRNVEALKSFLKAQKIDPTCSFINTLIAFTLLLEKKFDKSKKIIKELVLQNLSSINIKLLKDIYKCCNFKILPNKSMLNKIELFFKEGSFLKNINMFDNICSQ